MNFALKIFFSPSVVLASALFASIPLSTEASPKIKTISEIMATSNAEDDKSDRWQPQLVQKIEASSNRGAPIIKLVCSLSNPNSRYYMLLNFAETTEVPAGEYRIDLDYNEQRALIAAINIFVRRNSIVANDPLLKRLKICTLLKKALAEVEFAPHRELAQELLDLYKFTIGKAAARESLPLRYLLLGKLAPKKIAKYERQLGNSLFAKFERLYSRQLKKRCSDFFRKT